MEPIDIKAALSKLWIFKLTLVSYNKKEIALEAISSEDS